MVSVEKSISPCTILVRSKWALEGDVYNQLHVGDLIKCDLVLQKVIWKLLDLAKLDVTAEMSINSTSFAFGGKSKIRFTISQNEEFVKIPFAFVPLKPGPLQMPKFTYGIDQEKNGIYFEVPSELSLNKSILPREEACRRYFAQQ